MSTLRKALVAISLLLLAVSAVQAASVLATVDSSEPFLIKGKLVPVAGINNWPAFSGDQIATQGSSALLSFRDGSYVLLDKNTEVLLTQTNGKAGLKVVKGQVSYKLADLSTLAFDSVAKTAKSGTLSAGTGGISALSDVGFFAQLQRRSAAPAPGSYPIQINWNTPPSGVTVTDGPLPVSAYRGQ